MEIHLDSEDRIRINADEQFNFIDIYHEFYGNMSIDLHPGLHYIEIRRKDYQEKMFFFPKKSYKKDFDFGWWEDAEVVYSVNKVMDHIKNQY